MRKCDNIPSWLQRSLGSCARVECVIWDGAYYSVSCLSNGCYTGQAVSRQRADLRRHSRYEDLDRNGYRME